MEEQRITKGFLEDALLSQGAAECDTVEKFEVKPPAADKGENYNSEAYVVKVWLTSGKVEELFVKLQLTDEGTLRWQTASGTFFNEVTAYSKVFPAMIEIQNTTEPLLPSTPKYYAGKYDSGFQNMVILENLRGYKMPGMKIGFNVQECEMAVKELAKLHALSFKLKHSRFADLQEKFNSRSLFSPEFLENFGMFFKHSLEAVVNVAKGKFHDMKTVRRIERLLHIDYEEILINACQPEEPMSFLCHGEPVGVNCMFKYDEDNKTPLDLKLIDFQCMRYSNPISDLGQLFYLTTQRSLRVQHMDQLLQVYYTTFRGHLHQLDVDIPGYNLEMFCDMFERKCHAFILQSFMYLPTLLSKPEDLPNFLDPNSDEIPAQFQNCIEKSGSGERLTDLVHEALEKGLI